MKKKNRKKQTAPLPRADHQIPISRVRPLRLTGPRYHLKHAREYPLLGCWIMADWKESGITPVIVACTQAPETVLFASFLVDLYCLGVKDCLARTDVPLKRFMRDLPELCNGAPEECRAEFAHEVVYGAIEYAAHYGFKPHPDFTHELVEQVLEPQEKYPRKHQVKFGKDGQPFYVAGPYEDEREARRVVDTLTRTAGEGNFNYSIGFGGEEFFEG